MAKKILIVDDNADVRLVMKEILSIHGFETVAVDSGERALKLLKKQKYDLVLLDIVMKHMDGLTVLKKIKGSLNTLPIPVIIVTGKNQDDTKQKAAADYCEDYLVKPVSPKVLVEKVKQVLSFSE